MMFILCVDWPKSIGGIFIIIQKLTHQMQFSKNQSSNVQQLLKGFGIDPQYGICYPENYNPKIFNKQPLIQCLTQISEKIVSKSVCEMARSMPSLELNISISNVDDFVKMRDCFYLHELLADLVHIFIVEEREKGRRDDEILLPYNVGFPLIEASKYLGIKLGMCCQFFSNWKIRTQKCAIIGQIPEDVKLVDTTRIYHYYQDERDKFDQDLFFGGSLIANFYLFRSTCLLLQLNEAIIKNPEICQQLGFNILIKIQTYLKSINDSNTYILNNFTQTFLLQKIRKYFKGFSNVAVETLEEKLTSSGAAGGFDPSFQIFQRLMGIKYEESLATAQLVFRDGFSAPTKKLISYLEQFSIIKQFCGTDQKLKNKYNEVIKQYGNFYTIHKQFLRKFLIDVDPSINKGMGGINLQDIMDRDKSIEKQNSQ